MNTFCSLFSFMLLFVIVGANNEALDPKAYWKKILPFTSMPSAIEKLIHGVSMDEDPIVDVDESLNISFLYNKAPSNEDLQNNAAIDTNQSLNITFLYNKAASDVNWFNNAVIDTDQSLNVTFLYNKAVSDKDMHDNAVVDADQSLNITFLYNIVASDVDLHNNAVTDADQSLNITFLYSKATSDADSHNNADIDADRSLNVTFLYNKVVSDVDLRNNAVIDANRVSIPSSVHNKVVSNVELRNKRATTFFLRNDLRPGKNFILKLATSNAYTSRFIPRHTADAIPFSTLKFFSILLRLNVSADSNEAAAMLETLHMCEYAPAIGETKQCATSLEAMIDFAITSLKSSDVAAVSTKGGDVEPQLYHVLNMRRVAVAGGTRVVICHPMAYAYAVFGCHSMMAIDVYHVDLVTANYGATAAKAVVVCHNDTTGWHPKNLAFRVLGLKPGAKGVCHFLQQGNVVWVARGAKASSA